MRGITQFGVKGKLARVYVGLFDIVEKVSEVAYRLNLPPQLGHVHNIFHVLMHKKYTYDSLHMLHYAEIPLLTDVTYEE